MIGIVSERPLLMTSTGVTGLGLSTLEILTPYVQFGIAVVSFLVVSVTLIIKVRELIKGGE